MFGFSTQQYRATTGRQPNIRLPEIIRSQSTMLPALYEAKEQRKASQEALDLEKLQLNENLKQAERALGAYVEQSGLEQAQAKELAAKSLGLEKELANLALKQQQDEASTSSLIGMGQTGTSAALAALKLYDMLNKGVTTPATLTTPAMSTTPLATSMAETTTPSLVGEATYSGVGGAAAGAGTGALASLLAPQTTNLGGGAILLDTGGGTLASPVLQMGTTGTATGALTGATAALAPGATTPLAAEALAPELMAGAGAAETGGAAASMGMSSILGGISAVLGVPLLGHTIRSLSKEPEAIWERMSEGEREREVLINEQQMPIEQAGKDLIAQAARGEMSAMDVRTQMEKLGKEKGWIDLVGPARWGNLLGNIVSQVVNPEGV